MTARPDRPVPDCSDASGSDGARVHAMPCTPSPATRRPPATRDKGRAEVWAVSGDRQPRYCVHVELTEQPVTAAELRATAEALLAFVDQVDDDARTETLIRSALAPILRELSAVRDLPDDDPRRQAALEAKHRLLFLVEEHEAERLQR